MLSGLLVTLVLAANAATAASERTPQRRSRAVPRPPRARVVGEHIDRLSFRHHVNASMPSKRVAGISRSTRPSSPGPPAAPAGGDEPTWGAAAPFDRLGNYTGPFTMLTADFLDGVADPGFGFGPEDKFAECSHAINGVPRSLLVFVDLDVPDSLPTTYWYDTLTGLWSKTAINAVPCPDPGEGSLLPRQGGYTVGMSYGPQGDRLLILGGTPTENNVYYSDDCGVTWLCYDGDQIWDPLGWAPILHVPGIIPLDPVIMAGGIPQPFGPRDNFSTAMYLSYDMGITWQRPQCYDLAVCSFAIPRPDTKGWCDLSNGGTYYKHCFGLPAAPALPGGLGSDWSRLYLWMEELDVGGDGDVYYLGLDNALTGWTQIDGAADGGFGRKVFIRGAVPGTGCFFSTDYLAEDLWIFDEPSVQSTNDFATAPTATGPWTYWTDIDVQAPWAPRASAALLASTRSSTAWLASGMTFIDGVENFPTFGDAWQIDVGICLLGPYNGLVCSGNGLPNLGNVTCTCRPGYRGQYCESGSPPSPSPAPGGGPTASGPSSVAVGLGVTAGVLGVAMIGVWSYARYFGGGPRVAAAAAAARAAALGVVSFPSHLLGGGGKAAYKPVGGSAAYTSGSYGT